MPLNTCNVDSGLPNLRPTSPFDGSDHSVSGDSFSGNSMKSRSLPRQLQQCTQCSRAFDFNHHVAPTGEVPADPLRRVSSSEFRQRSPKGCTSSNRLSVRRNCQSWSEAAGTDCSTPSCQSSSCLGPSSGAAFGTSLLGPFLRVK